MTGRPLAGDDTEARAADTEARARIWIERAGLGASTGLVRLAGDASDRQFFRVVPPRASSRVLVVHAGPIDPETLPLIEVAALFRRLPVPVPAIEDADAALGIVVVEDLGDTTLEAALDGATGRERVARYHEAVGLIAAIQRGGRRLAASGASPFRLAFDVAKLTWELEFFVEHFLVGYRQCAVTPPVRAAMAAEFRTLAAEMAAEARVLCHRDFHSRNLMVHRERLHVIDFQDARLGPDTYDLVSLLRDAYVELDATFVDRLLAHYQDLMEVSDGVALRRRFIRTTVQRSLKALGTFGYQIAVRGNPRYRDAIPRTLAYVRDAVRADPGRQGLRDLLAPLLPEIAS